MILNFLQIGQSVFNLHIVWVQQEKLFKDFEVHFQLEMYQYCQKLNISVKMFLTKVCQVHAFWMDITGTVRSKGWERIPTTDYGSTGCRVFKQGIQN